MSMYVDSEREIHGVTVKIVHDEDSGADPAQNDNAGTIYSWDHNRSFEGDEYINEPESLYWSDAADAYIEIDLATYMRHEYDAALTIPLRFEDYGSSGARLRIAYEDSANAAICFTQKEIDYEWSGHIDPYTVTMRPSGEIREYGGARRYAEARIEELDQWMQGNVWGVVIEHEGEVLEQVWGLIGDPDSEWIRAEADAIAEAVAEQIAHERAEQFRWACADVVTV